jgi:hypothetical protein
MYIADPPIKAKNKSSYNYTMFVANRATCLQQVRWRCVPRKSDV